MTPQQLYEEVLSHARKSASKCDTSIERYCWSYGHDYRTIHSLLYQSLPQRGKLSLFIKLLTDYIIENYERKNKNNSL